MREYILGISVTVILELFSQAGRCTGVGDQQEITHSGGEKKESQEEYSVQSKYRVMYEVLMLYIVKYGVWSKYVHH